FNGQKWTNCTKEDLFASKVIVLFGIPAGMTGQRLLILFYFDPPQWGVCRDKSLSDCSGNVFLVNVNQACFVKDTSLAKYGCLIFDDRATSWKAPVGVMT
ncbi:MAG TPA: hypothetical protein DEP38_03020, partial [Cyanobacteria bacterium UBA9226]|nr:hypothetical protein [Cyanobacteria bacterium UBA9226]